jgi:hypothetical protein
MSDTPQCNFCIMEGCRHADHCQTIWFENHKFDNAEWAPTAENINTLPAPIRDYIHQLETNADPAGIVRENTLAKDISRALCTEITSLRQQVAELEARLSAYREALEACIPHIEGTIAWMETTVIDYGDSPYYTGSVELLEKIKRQALAGDTKKDTSA